MILSKKLELLANISENEPDVNLVLDKLLSSIESKYKNQLSFYINDLHKYENQYSMSSDIFYKKFNDGELGDSMDYFEWSALCDVTMRFISN